MKRKALLVVLALIINSSSFINNGISQWQTDVRLTNAAGESYTSPNNAWCIASNGNTVHVVWRDMRDGNTEIYYKRSTNAGISWGDDFRLTYGMATKDHPSISVSGSVLHIVWEDNRDANYEIYYKRSTDAGASWGTDTRLTNNTSNSWNASLSVSGPLVHIVWEDNIDGNPEIYYKRSTDAGVNWGSDTRLTNNAAYSYTPCISVSGPVVHVVWTDYRNTGNIEIYYKRSTNGGLNWETDTRLTNNVSSKGNPSISALNSIVNVVWNDSRDGAQEIFNKRSTDSGIIWDTDTRLTSTTNSGNSYRPSISVSGNWVHIIWDDDRDGNNEVYYKNSSNSGLNWGVDMRLTVNPAYSILGSVSAVSDSLAFVVWCDNRSGDYDIYFKRNFIGSLVEIKKFNSDVPTQYSLLQNYPNPFNPSTKIKFNLAKLNDVKIVVYDIIGREVQTLVNERLQPGTYETSLDGSMLNSGVYFYKIIADEYIEIKKMLLIK